VGAYNHAMMGRTPNIDSMAVRRQGDPVGRPVVLPYGISEEMLG